MNQQVHNEKFADAIEKTYSHIGNFILLGLTGRTGSGCSTAAKILGQDKATVNMDSIIYTSENDKRKLKIISNYSTKNWEPFYSIRVTTVISYFILDLNFHELTLLLSSVLRSSKSEELAQKLSHFKSS